MKITKTTITKKTLKLYKSVKFEPHSMLKIFYNKSLEVTNH